MQYSKSETAIVIVTYNGSNDIIPCINSIISQHPVPDIIVVDNNSTDNTKEIITENFPQVHLISLTANTGFANGNNVAFRYLFKNQNLKYIFLINQDTFSPAGVINELLKYKKEFPGFGILSPMQYDNEGNIERFFKNYIPAGKTDETKIIETDFVNAAYWLIDKEVLNNAGIFDQQFFPHYGEDNNLCQRAIYFGYKVGIVPSVRVIHYRTGKKIARPKEIVDKPIRHWLTKLTNINRPLLHEYYHLIWSLIRDRWLIGEKLQYIPTIISSRLFRIYQITKRRKLYRAGKPSISE